jgi:hypothetical protein
MVKNLSREFATMSDDERRKFALEEEAGNRELPAELEFDNPRNEDRMGAHYGSLSEEVADPEHRDGVAAELDDAAHERGESPASDGSDNPDAGT